jgi:hypothetical protein
MDVEGGGRGFVRKESKKKINFLEKQISYINYSKSQHRCLRHRNC